MDYQLDVRGDVPLEYPLAVCCPVECHVDHFAFYFVQWDKCLISVKQIIYLGYVYFIYSFGHRDIHTIVLFSFGINYFLTQTFAYIHNSQSKIKLIFAHLILHC